MAFTAPSQFSASVSFDAIDAYKKGLELHNQNKLQEAIAQYDKAIQIHKTFGEAINHKGIALLSMNRCNEAIAVFDRATQLNPKDAIAYNFRGVCLHNLKNSEEALKSYNKGEFWRRSISNKKLIF